jgi:hypothetical protein
MLLLRIDVIEGRSEAELKQLLDSIHGRDACCVQSARTRPLSDCARTLD